MTVQLPTGQPGWLWPTVLVLAVVAVGAVLVVGYVADRRRRERLLVWSAQQRWTWRGSDAGLVHFLPGEPFGRGDRRRTHNVLQGRFGSREAVAFDYTFRLTTGSGKNRRTRTYRYGVVALLLPAPLPLVHVGPENLFHRIAQEFGMDDIDVESDAFNRRYRVQAADRRAAFAILHPRLVETLTQVEPVEWRTGLSVRGPVLLTWWTGSLDTVRLTQRLILLDRIVASVPDYVWREAGWEPIAPDPG